MITQSKKLKIYSARDQNLKSEERQFCYESVKHYKGININYYSLHSKVKLLKAYEQMFQMANIISSEKHLVQMVTKTNWMYYVENTLVKSFYAVNDLKKQNILIHCPSGDDGSAVLSSLI